MLHYCCLFFFIKFIIYSIIEHSINSKISITHIAHLFVLHKGFTISLIILLSVGSLYCINYLLLYILSEEFRVEKRTKFIEFEENLKENIKRREYYDNKVDQNQAWWEERRKRKQEKEDQDRIQDWIKEERDRFKDR